MDMPLNLMYRICKAYTTGDSTSSLISYSLDWKIVKFSVQIEKAEQLLAQACMLQFRRVAIQKSNHNNLIQNTIFRNNPRKRKEGFGRLVDIVLSVPQVLIVPPGVSVVSHPHPDAHCLVVYGRPEAGGLEDAVEGRHLHAGGSPAMWRNCLIL